MPKKVELDLCKLTESAILLQKVAYKDIIFKFRKSEDCIFILGDGQMLNQAFLNLIKNSIESINSAKSNPSSPHSINLIFSSIGISENLSLGNVVVVKLFNSKISL